jgi:glutathione S-transferase
MLKLFYSPVSTYSLKVMMALYEKDIPFEKSLINFADAKHTELLRRLNPLGKVPVLIADKRSLSESTIIIDYLDAKYPDGKRLIPQDPELARYTRLFDRYADLYLNEPVRTLIFDKLKPEAEREPRRASEARATIDAMYRILDANCTLHPFTIGDEISLADVAAAPPLAFLAKVHPFDAHPNLSAYYRLISERPSFQKLEEELAPHRERLGLLL